MTSTARWSRRLATLVLQTGVLAVVVVALPYKLFDLDRFFVPKEAVLLATAWLASAALLWRARALAATRLDVLLAGYLVLGLLSALVARNEWLVVRALGVSAGGILLFWAARGVANGQYAPALVWAIATAGVTAAAVALVQAYGGASTLFSLDRAPGGTLGNRNFVAHVAVITAPALVVASLRARHAVGVLAGAVGIASLAALLVLSRTRAAWVALAVCGVWTGMLVWRARVRWPGHPFARRPRVLTLTAGTAVVAALVIPNSLHWRSDSPYADSVRDIANYQAGSGRGRVVQYRNTLRLARSHPILGVGAGNWPVMYPTVARRGDPSLAASGRTANPWPSSDWMAFLAERGVPACALLVAALLALGAASLRAFRRAPDPEAALVAGAFGATLLAILVLGAFDAVLLLPATAGVGWVALGALAPAPAVERAHALTPAARRRLAGALAIVCVVFFGRTLAQGTAMALASAASPLARLETAGSIYPGSYRIQMRIAALARRDGDCRTVRVHASAAHRLFPAAPRPRRMLAACGAPVR